MATTQVNILNLQVGNVVHFHGARFEITTTRIVNNSGTDNQDVMCANGKWLDGAVVNGYFGPKKDWGFQGNSRVSHSVEVGA